MPPADAPAQADHAWEPMDGLPELCRHVVRMFTNGVQLCALPASAHPPAVEPEPRLPCHCNEPHAEDCDENCRCDPGHQYHPKPGRVRFPDGDWCYFYLGGDPNNGSSYCGLPPGAHPAVAERDDYQEKLHDALLAERKAVAERDEARRLSQERDDLRSQVSALQVLARYDAALKREWELEARLRAAEERAQKAEAAQDQMQDDMATLLRALGLGDHARPYSPHAVMVQEIVPTAQRLQADKAQAEAERDEARKRIATFEESSAADIRRSNEFAERAFAAESQVSALQAQVKGMTKATAGFRWLGNNLHNVKDSPEQFVAFYRAALEDAEAALATAQGEGK